MDSAPATRRRWTAFRVTVFVECLVLLVYGFLAALRPIVFRLSPEGARKQAVRRLERRDYRRGLDALASYAQRFPAEAAKAGTLKIGDPVRLIVEFRADGLVLTSPVLPITAGSYADAGTDK
ncbi:MAG: hypothetical protein HYU66_01240, partial [Armatimonadetes bacterium]|nr:hypothetical protein [Armatimonadota bacterium]